MLTAYFPIVLLFALAFGFAAANQPRDAYVLDIAENRLEPWTRSEPGAVDAAKR